jgi:hypothetical protein
MRIIIALATLTLLLFLPTISLAQAVEGPATTVKLGNGTNNTAHFVTLSSSFTSDFKADISGRTESTHNPILTGKISNGGPDECELTLISWWPGGTWSTNNTFDNLTLPSGTWDAYINEFSGNWRPESYYHVEAEDAPATGSGD